MIINKIIYNNNKIQVQLSIIIHKFKVEKVQIIINNLIKIIFKIIYINNKIIIRNQIDLKFLNNHKVKLDSTIIKI